MVKHEANIALLWSELARLSETGELRRLSYAFARFVASLGAAPPALVLATSVLSELEGQGHSCLLLSDLAAGPAGLLGWEDEQWKLLARAAGPLPKNAQGWAQSLSGCQQVWDVSAFDYDQPLVLDGDRLYLRRYWRDEMLVAQAVRERATRKREVDEEAVRGWLDMLFA